MFYTYNLKHKPRFHSREVLRKLFFFMQRVIKEDLYLYSHTQGNKSEVESNHREIFTGYKSSMEKRQKLEWEQFPAIEQD